MNNITNYLGIDWGEKRIGLATADSDVKLALPLATVANLEEVLQIVLSDEIDIIVLGSPQKMSGQEANNPLWLDFYNHLKKRFSKPIELIDERLSSLQADALGGRGKAKAGRDEVAAAIILQSYLDKR